jgi:hypothetical protein
MTKRLEFTQTASVRRKNIHTQTNNWINEKRIVSPILAY